MKPLICCSIENLKEFSFEDYPFDGYEFKGLGKGFSPNIILLTKLKEMFNGKALSLHSQLSRIFSSREKGFPEFSEAEMNILKSEIIISKILGVKQINFHMKETEFSEDEIKKFNEVIDFASKNGIEMIYENHVCSDEVIFRVLKNFPRVKFCLDIGHLNVARHQGKFKIDLNEFIEKVKPNLVHLHAHNNYGEKDEHNSLDKGNFDWKNVLDYLGKNHLKKIIIESKKKEDVLKSKKLLLDYLKE